MTTLEDTTFRILERDSIRVVKLARLLERVLSMEENADVTDAINVAAAIVSVADKATPVDADTLPLIDSADASALKEVTWANVKATLTVTFDTLYQPLDGTLTSIAALTLGATGALLLEDATAANARDTIELGAANSPTFAGLSLTGALGISVNSVPAATIERLGNSINSVLAFINSSGTVYAGHGAANTFAIGGSSNLASGGDTWMEVSDGHVSIDGGAAVNVQPLEVISSDDSSSFGPEISAYRDSASPSVDTLGFYSFYGNNSAAGKVRYAGIAGGIMDPTAGTESGRMYLQVLVGGVAHNVVQIDEDVVELNYGQIKFPATANPSSNANTLDEYEEGTWTPVVVGTTTAGTGTYTTQTGSYTKIGRLVFIESNCAWSAHTGTGPMQIDGLPFTPDSNTCAMSLVVSALVRPADSQLFCQTIASTSRLQPATATEAGGGLTGLTLDTAATFRCAGCYTGAN